MRHLHNLVEDTVDSYVDDRVPSDPPRHSATQLAELRFRAPTVDEALADATSELGPDVEIVEANRIRRGGVGGFFATDLGVEIVVAPAPIDIVDRHRGQPLPRLADPSVTDRPLAAPRPQFYDRDREDADVELVTLAGDDRGDQAPSPDRSGLGIDEATDATSFAQHFARQMSVEPLDPAPSLPDPSPAWPPPGARARREPDTSPTRELDTRARRTSTTIPRQNSATADEPPAIDPSEPSPAEVAGVCGPAGADHHDGELPAAIADTSIADAPHPTGTGDELPRPEPAEVPCAEPSELPHPESGARHDTLRQPADLVTTAVDHVVTQLSDTAPAEGSRLHDLRCLRVTLTTADGDVIEVAADLGDR